MAGQMQNQGGGNAWQDGELDIGEVPDFGILDRICCIGANPLGVLTTHVWAARFPNKQFCIIDLNDAKIQRYINARNAGANGVAGLATTLPFHEPGFPQLFANIHWGPNQNVFFFQNHHFAIMHAQVIIIAIELDLVSRGRVEGLESLKLTEWENVVLLVNQNAHHRKLIVDISPFPNLESNHFLALFDNNLQFSHIVVSNPQFFSYGTAVDDLEHPDRVALALKSQQHMHIPEYLELVEQFYPPNQQNVIRLGNNFTTAEFGRLAANACLGVLGVFANMCASMSNGLDMNVEAVMQIVTNEDRIGQEFLNPNVAVGGPNLIRDMYFMCFVAKHCHMDDAARFMKNAIASNNERIISHLKLMRRTMEAFPGKTIAVFGFSFKENTSEIRHSPAVTLCKKLYKEGCNLRIYDSLVAYPVIRGLFPNPNRVVIMGKNVADMQATCNYAHALCFFTRDATFQLLDWVAARAVMPQHRPVYVFDLPRNHFDQNAIRNAGFQLHVSGVLNV